jgi:hypothetical protein
MSSHATAVESQPTDRDAAESPTQPDMVYVDAYTGLYHHSADAAGPDPTSFSRPQADLVGFDPCPTCFSAGAHGGEAET